MLLTTQIPLPGKAKARKLVKGLLVKAKIKTSKWFVKNAVGPFKSILSLRDVLQQDFDFKADFNIQINDDLDA